MSTIISSRGCSRSCSGCGADMRPSSPLLLLLFVAAWLLAHPVAASPVWDERLDPLNVTHVPAADCSTGCWRLVSAAYEDEQQSAGLHHVWARLLDEQGQEIGSAPWRLTWHGGEQHLTTKAPGEWADAPLWDCYFPEQGPGAYTAYAGVDPARSDAVAGMGLPACHHVSFRLVWRWTVEQPPPDLPLETYLPIAIK
jgi:hypothetical protein